MHVALFSNARFGRSFLRQSAAVAAAGATAAFGLVTLAHPAAAAGPAVAQTITVTPPSGLLNTSETRTAGHNDFLEQGLHVYTDDSSSQAKAAGYLAQDEPLADVAGAAEPTLGWTNDPGMSAVPGKQIVVDFDGTGGPDGILVGEPVYGNEWWLSNSATQFVKDSAPHTGGGFGSNWYGTLAEWSASFGSAQVVSVGYSLGSGLHGGGVISSMSYGSNTYLFALGLGPCEALIDNPTLTFTLTKDCSTLHTITAADGATIDGNGHTLTAVEDGTHPNFPGPIVLSATGSASAPAALNVTDLAITTSFSGSNSGGQLAGIKFDRAGGSVTSVSINGVTHGNGVQEGIALYVRNRGADGSSNVPGADVAISGLTVTRYQKAGVVIDGNVDFAMTTSSIGPSTDQSGNPIAGMAANAVQISRGAHGTLSDSSISLNDYSSSDDWIATGVLVYNAAEVTLTRSLVTGPVGDIGMDTYNDGTGSFDTVVNASCNLFQHGAPGDAPDGAGISQSDDGSVPVELNLTDTTFQGWAYDTAIFDAAGDPQPGPASQPTGACAPTQPTVSATGGAEVVNVTWSPATAPAYAPISGYDVTLTGDDSSTQTLHLDADATAAHFAGLTDGVAYTVDVSAINASGPSTAGEASLASTSLTIGPDKATLPYKHTTRVRGVLSSSDSSASLAGRTIKIEARPNGSPTWTVLGTATTDAAGGYSLSVAPTKQTAYRATYAGGPDMGIVSAPASVYVQIKVKATVSDRTVSLGTTVLFTGKAAPNQKGRDVYLEHRVGGAWELVQTSTLKKAGRYKFFWDADIVGTSDWRVSVPASPNYLKGSSKTITMVVS